MKSHPFAGNSLLSTEKGLLDGSLGRPLAVLCCKRQGGVVAGRDGSQACSKDDQRNKSIRDLSWKYRRIFRVTENLGSSIN